MNVNVNVNLWSLLNLSVSLMLTDIDVMEPDEKSIVTYVSLLYDIFPNVPSLEQSLRDNVSYTSVSYYWDFMCLFILVFSRAVIYTLNMVKCMPYSLTEFCSVHDFCLYRNYYAPASNRRGIKRWCCLTSDVCLASVCRVHREYSCHPQLLEARQVGDVGCMHACKAGAACSFLPSKSILQQRCLDVRPGIKRNRSCFGNPRKVFIGILHCY